MLERCLHLQPSFDGLVTGRMNTVRQYRIALVIPRSGPPGLYGPSSRNCAELAVEHLNADDGIDGAHVSLVLVDAAQRPQRVAEAVGTLLDTNAISAIVGMHDSDVRRALVKVIDDRAPYVYAANYEGETDGDVAIGVGLTAAQQIRGSVEWLAEHRGIREWYFIGNDYVWPRGVLSQLESVLKENGLRLGGAEFVALGKGNYSGHLSAILQTNPDAVCAALVGADAVTFSRQFIRRGLDRSIARFLPLFEENSLLAVGEDAGRGVFTAGCFFAGSGSSGCPGFQADYEQRFGSKAPQLNGPALACYDAVKLLAAIPSGKGVNASTRSATDVLFRSALGQGRLHDGHAVRDVFLAEAIDGQFETRACFHDVSADGFTLGQR